MHNHYQLQHRWLFNIYTSHSSVQLYTVAMWPLLLLLLLLLLVGCHTLLRSILWISRIDVVFRIC